MLRVDQVGLGDAELTVIAGARQWSGLRELDLSEVCCLGDDENSAAALPVPL